MTPFPNFLWIAVFAIVLARPCVADSPPLGSSGPAEAKPHRLIVLSDIEADPDDTQSMVRLLLYSDVIDLEGLIATTSTWKQTSVAPDSIRAVIHQYAKVQPNLTKHDPHYPTPGALEAMVTQGRPEYGMTGVGPGKDSAGSNWIIQCLENNDDRPLWISVWGGANTLAQALHTLRATKPPEELERLVAKLRVYAISDQDDAGPWIRKNFPTLFYIVTPGGAYGSATWSGINTVVPGLDNTTISNKWIAEHLQQGHGPLGAAYPDVSWGMEGDTPSWLALIPNGLSEPEHPNWGGWGGRYEWYRPDQPNSDPSTFVNHVAIEPETRPTWTNAIDDYAPPTHPEYGRTIRAGEKSFKDAKVTLWRWRDDFQNDFAARMDWTTKSPSEANHPPLVVLNQPNRLTVKSGTGFGLGARGTDPDGDSLSYFWFIYAEAGSYKGTVKIDGAENSGSAWVIAPQVEKSETVHIILRVMDRGSPPLTRYQRTVVTVMP
jgi:cellulose-binding protein